MTKAQPKGVLGNFIVDLCLIWSNRSYFQPADICILNHEGLKTSLSSGNITVGNTYELIPNNHTLVLLKLKGKQLREVINYVINTCGQPFGGMAIYKNQGYLNNLSISDSQKYWIITTDYLANGGNNMGFLQHAIERINTNVLLRDVIIKHYQMLTLFRGTANAKIDNRIQL
jgi:2',3'-cyclic-nucleotide 2'-phosphodiesterase (5'-nucleotidase family)